MFQTTQALGAICVLAACPSTSVGQSTPDKSAEQGWKFQAELKPGSPETPSPSPASPQAEPPAIPYTLSSVEHRINLQGQRAEFRSAFKGRSFLAKQQFVPLLSGKLQLVSADEKVGSLVAHGGKLCVLTSAAEVFEGTMELSAALQGFPAGLTFLAEPAARQQIIVAGVPAGSTATINGDAPDRLQEGEAVFHLPPNGGEVILRIEKPAENTPAVPSQWRVDSQISIVYADGALAHTARVFCHADTGSGLSAEIKLPSNATDIDVEGEDLARWFVARRDAQARVIKVDWKTSDILDRRLRLQYAVPQSPVVPNWTLQAPSAEGESKALYALALAEGMEFSAEGLRGPLSGKQLPFQVEDEGQDLSYMAAEGGTSFVLNASILARVEPVKATVSTATFTTKLDSSGAFKLDGEYSVHHRGPVRFLVELPDKSSILVCKIADRDVSPVLRGKALEFPLPAKDDGQPSKVTICCHYKGASLDPVSGRMDLVLPKTDIFIENVLWKLQLPDNYECETFQGNVESASGQADAHTLLLKKQLCQAEAPALELYYQKSGLQD